MKWYQSFRSVLRLLNLDTLKRVLAVTRDYVELAESYTSATNEGKQEIVAEALSNFIEKTWGWKISPEVLALIIKVVVELCTKHASRGE